MLSDISFGIVDTLPDAAVPKDKLPYVPGKTDVPALKSRCENNLDKQGHFLFKVWKKTRGGQRIHTFQTLNKEFYQGLCLYFEGDEFRREVDEAYRLYLMELK